MKKNIVSLFFFILEDYLFYMMRFIFICVFFLAGVHLLCGQFLFKEFQAIPTHGAEGWETFAIEGKTYLAQVNFQNDSSYEINSAIHIWNGEKFQHFQDFPTSGGTDLEYFEIDQKKFLAVSNYKNNKGSYKINSQILSWNGSGFVPFQNVLTSGAYRLKFCSIGTSQFLVIANQSDSTGDIKVSVDSQILKWDGEKFLPHQSIENTSATDLSYFFIGGNHYLGIALTLSFNSKIYKWDGNHFSFHQDIPSTGATALDFFSIHNENYLGVANGAGPSGFKFTNMTSSALFKWDGKEFIIHQTIPTNGAFDLKYFQIKQDHYLAVANFKEDNGNHNIESPIYKWNGSGFTFYQNIQTHGATEWEFIKVQENYLVAVSNYKNDSSYNINSKLYTCPADLLGIEDNVSESKEISFHSSQELSWIDFRPTPEQMYDIQVTDVTGKIVYFLENKLLHPENSRIFLRLSPGLYIAKVQAKGSRPSILKLIQN